MFMGIFVENKVFKFKTKKNEFMSDEFFAEIDAVQ